MNEVDLNRMCIEHADVRSFVRMFDDCSLLQTRHYVVDSCFILDNFDGAQSDSLHEILFHCASVDAT